MMSLKQTNKWCYVITSLSCSLTLRWYSWFVLMLFPVNSKSVGICPASRRRRRVCTSAFAHPRAKNGTLTFMWVTQLGPSSEPTWVCMLKHFLFCRWHIIMGRAKVMEKAWTAFWICRFTWRTRSTHSSWILPWKVITEQRMELGQRKLISWPCPLLNISHNPSEEKAGWRSSKKMKRR